jgi:hypothetical protein
MSIVNVRFPICSGTCFARVHPLLQRVPQSMQPSTSIRIFALPMLQTSAIAHPTFAICS